LIEAVERAIEVCELLAYRSRPEHAAPML